MAPNTTQPTKMFLIKPALGVIAVAATMLVAPEAFARGGAVNIMNSPGYQRALEESRKRLPPANPQPAAVDHHHQKRKNHYTR